MCRKLILLISFIAMLAMAANVSAADEGISAQWDGEGMDGLWSTALNWDGDLVPDANVTINSDILGLAVNPDVDEDINTEIVSLAMNAVDLGSTATLNMDGVSLTITGFLPEGEDFANGIGTNQDANTYGTVILDINDSTLTLEGDAPLVRFDINSDVNGATELLVQDSFLNLDYIFAQGDFKWYMDNSLVQFTPDRDTDNYIARYGGYTDIKWTNSTVIQHGDPDHYDGPYVWDAGTSETDPELRAYDTNTVLDMNIVDSQFWWRGRWYFNDSVWAVNFIFTNSDIYAAKFLIRQSAGKDNVNITNSRIITSSYHRYSEKIPAGNQGTWGTIDHSVMRGSDVDWRDSSNPGHLNFIFSYCYTTGDDVDKFQGDIDTGKFISHDGNGVWGGPIYVPYYNFEGDDGGFTVLTAIPDANYAWGYFPHDAQPEGMPMPTKLMWFPSADANHQDVYVSKDKQLVEDMNVPLALEDTVAGDGNSVTMSAFQQPQETWYWRVVTIADDDSETAGPVLQFKTPDGKAIRPNPEHGDGSAVVSPDGRVSWTSGGPWVTDHDLYFDPNEQKVIDVNFIITGLLSKQLGLVTEYADVGLLELGSKYYWRVDERGGAFEVEGDVWQFTLGNYFVIEDFETYTDTADLRGSWSDLTTSGSGAEITLKINIEDSEIAHSGTQYMKVYYDNWGGYSYTDRPTAAQDWVVSDTAALAIYFRGDSSNLEEYVETMAVTLSDSDSSASLDYDGDKNNIMIEDWFIWNMAFKDFTGVDANEITNIKIDFADEVEGLGIVYFDDFRLYQRRCRPETTGLKADLTDDCIVNADDLEVIGAGWLKAGLGTVNKTTPDAAKLVLQYLFDESAGSNLADNINSYDGTYIVDPNGTLGDISDGRSVPGMSGNAFYCTVNEDDIETGRYDICIDIPNDPWIDHNMVDDITLSMWMKNHRPESPPDGGANLLEFRQYDGVSTSGGDLILSVTTSDNTAFEFIDDGGNSGASQQDWDAMTDWTLFIFTKDVDNLRIYNNGVMVASGAAGDYMKVP